MGAPYVDLKCSETVMLLWEHLTWPESGWRRRSRISEPDPRLSSDLPPFHRMQLPRPRCTAKEGQTRQQQGQTESSVCTARGVPVPAEQQRGFWPPGSKRWTPGSLCQIKPYLSDNWGSSILFKIFYFVLFFRERGKEGEREGETYWYEKHRLVVFMYTLKGTPTGDWTRNPGVCPDWEVNRQTFSFEGNTQPTEPHWLGQSSYLFTKNNLRYFLDIEKLSLSL